MAELKRAYKCNCKEVSIDHNGSTYLVICGKHINGAYCALPEMSIAAELSSYDGDYDYNEKKLIQAFSDCTKVSSGTAAALSKVITDIIQELPDVLPF